jgi:hypothetical protein
MNGRRKSQNPQGHFADNWQVRPLVFTEKHMQRQFLDRKNTILVLPPPFSPHLAPRDFVSENEIATANASFARRPRNTGTLAAVTALAAACDAFTPKGTMTENKEVTA